MEFELIRQYFEEPFACFNAKHGHTLLRGIGDDCAQLRIPDGHTLYVSSDTSVQGVHFFPDDPPQAISAKALATNLSDLAACGAQPLGFSLNLTLPAPCTESTWMQSFSSGLYQLASAHDCPLVGGDTTRGPCLAVSITVYGHAPKAHHGFHRSLAQVGQDLWVSGVPGLARLGMLCAYQARDRLNELYPQVDHLLQIRALLDGLGPQARALALGAFESPLPRIQLGTALRPLASACMDLSDGLSGDLGHIVAQSGVALHLQSEDLLSSWGNIRQHVNKLEPSVILALALEGGDDYELCFTAWPHHRGEIAQVSKNLQIPLQRVGTVHAGRGVFMHDAAGLQRPVPPVSYNHLANPHHTGEST
ncbi:MAG TPA: thiamine-phosphate kinase [Limnobacter sp.]|nr:thiamine-phosphate kinase [Limnobacter sp.]